ncbi:MAG: hypothetical protein QMD78_02475 [Methanocellales archaeon]|nr:hypothetical protein [Methanocellales archaeon]
MKLQKADIQILYKLFRHTRFGRGHMHMDNLTRGFPSHLKGNVKEAVNELIRKGLLVEKSTRHGIAVHINFKRLDEIIAMLEENLGMMSNLQE